MYPAPCVQYEGFEAYAHPITRIAVCPPFIMGGIIEGPFCTPTPVRSVYLHGMDDGDIDRHVLPASEPG